MICGHYSCVRRDRLTEIARVREHGILGTLKTPRLNQGAPDFEGSEDSTCAIVARLVST